MVRLTSNHSGQTQGDTSHSHARTQTLTGACPASEHGARQAGTELWRAVSSGGTTFTPPHCQTPSPTLTTTLYCETFSPKQKKVAADLISMHYLCRPKSVSSYILQTCSYSVRQNTPVTILNCADTS